MEEQLEVAARNFREAGPSAVIEHKNLFVSIIEQQEVPRLIFVRALDELERALKLLPGHIATALKDKEGLNDVRRATMRDVITTLIYLTSKLVIAVEKSAENDERVVCTQEENGDQGQPLVDATKQFKTLTVVAVFKELLKADLASFLDVAGLDSKYIDLITDVCYLFLETPAIRNERAVLMEIWDIFGILASVYNVAEPLAKQLVSKVRQYKHLALLFPVGVSHITTIYKHSILHIILKEMLECQISEPNVASNDSLYGPKVLVNVAIKLPNEMMSELEYLKTFQHSDSIELRCTVIAILVEIALAPVKDVDCVEAHYQLLDDVVESLFTLTAHDEVKLRIKAYDHLTRLAKSDSISIVPAIKLMERIIANLCDNTTAVRISAAACCTAILRNNTFHGHFSLVKVVQECIKESTELKKFNTELRDLHNEIVEKNKIEWQRHVQGLTEYVEQTLKTKFNETPSEEKGDDIIISMLDAISAGDYASAFTHCCTAMHYSGKCKWPPSDFIEFMNTRFMNAHARMPTEVLKASEAHVVESQVKVGCLKNVNNFIIGMHKAHRIIVTELLHSDVLGERMQAVAFISAACKCNIDNAFTGITSLLKLLESTDEHRRNMSLEALTTIYFKTDDKNANEDMNAVIERLTNIAINITPNEQNALSLLIGEWAKKDMFAKNMVSTLWENVTNRDAAIGTSSTSLCLLLHLARQCFSIVHDNYEIVMRECFDKRALSKPMQGDGDIQLAIQGLRFLQLLETPIKNEHHIWKKHQDILRSYLTPFSSTSMKVVNWLVIEIVRCIFHIGFKPTDLLEDVVDVFSECMALAWNEDPKNLPNSIIISWNYLVGEAAIAISDYLEFAPKEDSSLKKDNSTEMMGGKKKKNRRKKKALDCSLAPSSSPNSDNEFQEESASNELCKRKAEGASEVSRYVHDFVEHLSQLPCPTGSQYENIINIVRKPRSFPHPAVQGTAVVALLLTMMLSREFCAKNIKLIFIFLSCTSDASLKIVIVQNLSSMVEKFPHVVEPFVPKIVGLLDDGAQYVRDAALQLLSQMTSADLILRQDHLWKIAICIADESSLVRKNATSFFTNVFKQKANKVLYNLLPEMFTHLCRTMLDVTKLHNVLSFLFGQIVNCKQIEWLIDEMCLKLANLADDVYAKHVTFALTQMPYNQRALRKLLEHFPKYKCFLKLDEVQEHVKNITAMARQNAATNAKELEAIALQLDLKVNEEVARLARKQQGTCTMPKKSTDKSKRGRARKK